MFDKADIRLANAAIEHRFSKPTKFHLKLIENLPTADHALQVFSCELSGSVAEEWPTAHLLVLTLPLLQKRKCKTAQIIKIPFLNPALVVNSNNFSFFDAATSRPYQSGKDLGATLVTKRLVEAWTEISNPGPMAVAIPAVLPTWRDPFFKRSRLFIGMLYGRLKEQ